MGCVSAKSVERAWESTVDYNQRELLARLSNNTEPAVLNPDDFIILNMIQIGGAGCIYGASRKNGGGNLAMKFFGYTAKPPIRESIMLEIELMQALQGVSGAVKLYGIFMDTDTGLVHGKRHRVSRPVIVMEYLSGGDMFQRIDNGVLTEDDLVKIVVKVVKALGQFHDHGIVHRDLKLENIMFVEDTEDSEIRLIDYGLMVTLPPGKDLYVGSKVPVGSPGHIAPESILRGEYSAKSDVWQLGCCVYCLLSGFNAFFTGVDKQVLHGEYFPMKGEEWDCISADAKDFIKQVFVVDPAQRPSCSQLLDHPWLRVPVASRPASAKLSCSYHSRIQKLGIRAKMKHFFRSNSEFVNGATGMIAEDVLKTCPQLLAGDGPGEALLLDSVFYDKLLVFQNITLQSLSARGGGEAIDFNCFAEYLRLAELPELASAEFFHIFSCNKSGTIRLKEFLVTMASLRSWGTHAASNISVASSNSLEADMRVYFNLFDLDRNGYLDKDEFKLLLQCIVQEESPLTSQRMRSFANLSVDDSQSVSSSVVSESTEKVKYHPCSISNLDEIFPIIDTSGDGHIDFNEFRAFYMIIFDIYGPTSSPALNGITRSYRSLSSQSSLGMTGLHEAAVMCLEKNGPTDTQQPESTSAPVMKYAGAGLAERVAGLDPSKIRMLGAAAPPVFRRPQCGDANGYDRISVNVVVSRPVVAATKRRRPGRAKKFIAEVDNGAVIVTD